MMPKIRIDRTSSVVATGRRMNGLSKVHDCSSAAAFAAAALATAAHVRHVRRGHRSSTRAPGVSRSWPSVTISSPVFTPSAITISSPDLPLDALTGRISTVRSALTT